MLNESYWTIPGHFNCSGSSVAWGNWLTANLEFWHFWDLRPFRHLISVMSDKKATRQFTMHCDVRSVNVFLQKYQKDKGLSLTLLVVSARSQPWTIVPLSWTVWQTQGKIETELSQKLTDTPRHTQTRLETPRQAQGKIETSSCPRKSYLQLSSVEPPVMGSDTTSGSHK